MYCLSKDRIDEVYASIQAYLMIEDYGQINKYIEIELYFLPDGSIHIRHPYLNQSILKIISGMNKTSNKPTPAVKPPLAKNEEAQARKTILITDQ